MKKKYIVEITETLQRQIIIEARNEKEAVKLIEDAYDNEEIVLDGDYITDIDFDAIEIPRSYEYER